MTNKKDLVGRSVYLGMVLFDLLRGPKGDMTFKVTLYFPGDDPLKPPSIILEWPLWFVYHLVGRIVSGRRFSINVPGLTMVNVVNDGNGVTFRLKPPLTETEIDVPVQYTNDQVNALLDLCREFHDPIRSEPAAQMSG